MNEIFVFIGSAVFTLVLTAILEHRINEIAKGLALDKVSPWELRRLEEKVWKLEQEVKKEGRCDTKPMN